MLCSHKTSSFCLVLETKEKKIRGNEVSAAVVFVQSHGQCHDDRHSGSAAFAQHFMFPMKSIISTQPFWHSVILRIRYLPIFTFCTIINPLL